MKTRKYRYFIELEFDGTNYHGWQIQPNAPTVQQAINERLSILLNEQIETVGAGRTDTGVHARHFVAHFDTHEPIEKKLTDLCLKLNSFLPPDISVFRIASVAEKAHARYDAITRTYQYFISTRKNVFDTMYSWPIYSGLNLDMMNAGAEILKHETDFTSFSKLHTDVKTNICHIETAIWSKIDDKLIFTISADRFLRNMVRAIVGTLVYLGKERINISDLKDIIAKKNRSEAGESAPAKGLFLQKVEYPYSF